MNLLANVKVSQVLGYFAAGQAAKKAAIIDMEGFEGCMFVYSFGTILETGTLACDINGNSVNQTGGAKLAGGATHTVTAADALLASSAIVVDINQPDPATSRYLEAMVTPAVANAVILGITAIQYNGKYKPDANAALLASSQMVSPAAA